MSVDDLARVDPGSFDVLSSDLFDTILLRDRSLQRQRFAEAMAAPARALGVDPAALARLRALLHASEYRALSV